MRVVVIGGSRFVGLHLTRELVSRGHDVTVVNRGQTAKELPAGVGRMVADRKADPGAFAEKVAAAGPWDAVYDCIAYLPTESEPLVRALWTARPEAERTLKHFVHISTGSVYAKTDYLPLKEDFPQTTNSADSYGWNKKLIEGILFRAWRETGLPVTVLRPGYIYGPDNHIYRESFFFDRVRRGRPVLVPGNGLTVTQFVYVDDLAQALALVLGNPKAVGETFNIAGEYGCTLDHYLRLVGEAVGQAVDIRHYDPDTVGITPEELRKVFPYKWREHTLRDTSKIREALGYREKKSLRDGLAAAYAWYLQNWPAADAPDFSLDDRILAALGTTQKS